MPLEELVGITDDKALAEADGELDIHADEGHMLLLPAAELLGDALGLAADDQALL